MTRGRAAANGPSTDPGYEITHKATGSSRVDAAPSRSRHHNPKIEPAATTRDVPRGSLDIVRESVYIPREGLDRLSITFPIEGARGSARCWKKDPEQEPGNHRRFLWDSLVCEPTPGFKVHVSHGYQRGGQRIGRVDCNPAWLFDPGGCHPMPVEDVPFVLDVLDVLVDEHLVKSCSVHDGNFTRIDWAADIATISPSLHLEAFCRRPGLRRGEAVARYEGGACTYVTAENGRYRLTVYDKSVQTNGLVPPGTLRCEVRLTRDGLRSGHLRPVAEFNAETVRATAHRRYQENGLHLPVYVRGVRYLKERLLADGWSEVRIRAFCGHLLQLSEGVLDRLSKGTAAAYRAAIRRYGIAFDGGTDLDAALDSGGYRVLNLDSAREEVVHPD